MPVCLPFPLSRFPHRPLALGMLVLLAAPPVLAAQPAVPANPTPPAAAQPPSPGPEGVATESAPAAVVESGVSADDLRRRFQDMLRQYPPSLREVLRNDPSLLDDHGYLSPYPGLVAFLRSHPQVARNPRFYVGDAEDHRPRDPRIEAIGIWRHATETLSMITIFALVAGALAWLVRTALDHRRWLRSSRIQVDVHQKLFDRLASNDDLMTYVQTPAGQRFLEGSPVVSEPTREARPVSAPINRILWSVQIGIVLMTLGIGLQWVARNVIDEVAQLLWFAGVMALTVGVGFVGSAGVAYLLSKRLGLIRETSEPEAPRSAAPLS